MPELPEVQTVVNTIAPLLRGRRMLRIEHLRRDIVHPDGTDLCELLGGKRIDDMTRRGKRIVMHLATGERFYFHSGMSGQLIVCPRAQEVRKHTHFIAALNGGDSQLRFRDPRRFGGIWWLGRHEDPSGGMGPEPLLVKTKQLAERLSRTTRAIKNVLLDQRVLAGIGNIYADEALHASGIHPLARADKLNSQQIERMNRAIKFVLRHAIKRRGSSLRDYVDGNGKAGGFQRLHRVYDRANEPCLTCGAKIIRIVLGGRSTCFCPTCQKRPARGARR